MINQAEFFAAYHHISAALYPPIVCLNCNPGLIHGLTTAFFLKVIAMLQDLGIDLVGSMFLITECKV